MPLIKHSKFKNTGILFELLVRQVTADTLNNIQSPALNIIKKYFVKSELGKELKLYESLTKSQKLSEIKSNILIQTILDASKKLNKTSLKKQKYNLINEIQKHYNLDEFFKTKLPNYKAQAALYTLIELEHLEKINIDQVSSNRFVLLEHLSNTQTNESKTKEDIVDEFKNYDKDLRILTYKILLEKFNGKYSNLYESQKQILKEFITSVDSTPKLKTFYNTKIQEIKTKLVNLNKKTTDKTIQIKLNEVLPLIVEIEKTSSIKNDNIIDLLQYCELVEELKKANEKV